MTSISTEENTSVFELITELCKNTALKCNNQNRVSQNHLISKTRSKCYEILLKKSCKEIPITGSEPIPDLLCYYFVLQQNIDNIIDYKRAAELKSIINNLCDSNLADRDNTNKILQFLLCMKDTVSKDDSVEVFQAPTTFGLIEQMLPRPQREVFGSAQPYQYYPPFIFNLPYSIKSQVSTLNNYKPQTYTECNVECFDSTSFLPGSSYSQMHSAFEIKNYMSPLALQYFSESQSSYLECGNLSFPRLSAPRDLNIPISHSIESDLKASLPNGNSKTDVQVLRAPPEVESVDVWEIASKIDKDLPDDLWEIASKMPFINERQLIAMNTREMLLWRHAHCDILRDLHVVTEKVFIHHIMYLVIGIETNSFPYCEETQCFYVKENLALEGVTKEYIEGYVSGLLLIGSYYRRLYNFAFDQCLNDHLHKNGLIYEAGREVVRRYLLKFRLQVTQIFEESCKHTSDNVNCMPTLLEILYHIEPYQYELETVATIFKANSSDIKTTIPRGAELMAYLFNEISLITHNVTANTLFNSLFYVCKVYFKFIERFIFDGELEDRYNEFFIRKDSQYINCHSKKYWDKGFYISQSVAIPEFLRVLAKCILLCGKSLRLLKLCNPNDPLVVLISANHPTVKCCWNLEQLEKQQQVLDVYRTRCLFVSGEPASFRQILLQREADRKAFTEMATQKQAETMEKIIAERKRFVQLIDAEKQHSLRVLEQAMAEAKAVKNKSRRREPLKSEMEQEAERARDQLDAQLRDDEKKKIMAYYSKLNMEVEKSKIHTEWKMKRLQLNQARIQVLSSEERNFKREKLELEHQKNEEIMATSINSIESITGEGDTRNRECIDTDEIQSEETPHCVATSANKTVESSNVSKTAAVVGSDSRKKNSTDVLNMIYNATRHMFGLKTDNSGDTKSCDNVRQLDSQGNFVPDKVEINSNVCGDSNVKSDLKNNEEIDNSPYATTKLEAIMNKERVLSHDFVKNYIEPQIVNETMVNLDVNIQGDTLNAFEEAKRNKIKVLGSEFDLVNIQPEQKVVEPRTQAQKEAMFNKQKVLGVEYNLPLDSIKREPANYAQEEALKNRKKILGSDDLKYEKLGNSRPANRTGLTLDLKPPTESNIDRLTITPTTSAVTPAEFFPRLDLETPTTAEIPFDGQMTGDVFTPHNDAGGDLDFGNSKPDKDLGFNFSNLIEEEEVVDSGEVYNVQTNSSVDSSPTKVKLDISNMRCYHLINDTKESSSLKSLWSEDNAHNFEDFDPFGVRDMKQYSKDYFDSKMNLQANSSCYTHPAIIMKECQRHPSTNTFAKPFSSQDDDDPMVTCDNIVILTACLQRSVMLPLTYQLEVVNNSILTHFLVNLDMYEHLSSLKDYFFLMDGEFSRNICHNIFTKLVKTLNPQELLNFATLHRILDKALGSSISHVNKFSENLTFTITEPPLSFHHSSPDVLQCLSLTYEVGWPLNIILSQEALSRYAKVFQFLVKMRRISWILGQDFEVLKLSGKLLKGKHKLYRSPQYVSVQLYRHIMASLIRALDNYIVTTCILTSWTEFENDLKKARTLDDLYDYHVVYIKKVHFRCLLNNRSTPVMKLLNDIFTVILKFSRVLRVGTWQQNDHNGIYTHPSFAQLEELFHLFEKLAKYLHKVVTKLMECGYQRHLAELLSMVNLNGYYEPEESKDRF